MNVPPHINHLINDPDAFCDYIFNRPNSSPTPLEAWLVQHIAKPWNKHEFESLKEELADLQREYDALENDIAENYVSYAQHEELEQELAEERAETIDNLMNKLHRCVNIVAKERNQALHKIRLLSGDLDQLALENKMLTAIKPDDESN